MRTVRINVTEEDIRDGYRDDGEACPIARAAGRAGLFGCSVDSLRIEWEDDGSWFLATMPREASAFVVAFDAGNAVAPFSFDVEAVRDRLDDFPIVAATLGHESQRTTERSYAAPGAPAAATRARGLSVVRGGRK